MDQRVRLMAASGVMLGGFLLALMFRQPNSGVEVPLPKSSDPLELRKQPGPVPVVADPQGAYQGAPASGAMNGSGQRPAAPTIVTANDRSGGAPPSLPKSYPESFQGTSRWGNSLGDLPQSAIRQTASPTHKVVDGDSLASLAEQYLGSPDRAMEIFEANRNLLSHPKLLPIGVELKIPAQRSLSDMQ